jgi:two-component system OmpR family sensor kinase/two-component system sensor histidine kinase QseC
LLGLLALVAAVAVFAGAIAYRRVLGESSTLFDYQLRQMALSLRDQAASGALVLPAHPADSDFVIQIWNPLGQSLYHSRPGPPLLAVLGYADVTLSGERWRVYSTLTPEAVIQVAQPWAVRQALARAAALRVVIPLLLLLPLMGLATTWIVGQGLAPLKRLAAEVQRRDVHSLTPIESPQLPEESRPLVEELNRLLARLSQAFDAQRAFVADAAHELRSPLTALSLQLQLLERAPDEAARGAARAKLAAAVERAIHLVGQLLTLARNEPEAAALELAPTSLDAAVRDAISDVGALAAARGIELTLDLSTPVTVRGDADALRVLARNLIDNAVRYTPAGGTAQVRVAALPAGDAVLIVQDSGPGIPVEERSRAFDRFYRRAGAGEGGTGLGLAIVKAIADRHLARVALEQAAPRGLIVTVAFPAPSAS